MQRAATPRKLAAARVVAVVVLEVGQYLVKSISVQPKLHLARPRLEEAAAVEEEEAAVDSEEGATVRLFHQETTSSPSLPAARR